MPKCASCSVTKAGTSAACVEFRFGDSRRARAMSGITGNEAQSGVDCQADSTLSFRCMPIITLTTDFGTKDWFVGSMKGVMLGINPQATIVDITHEVPAGDIRTGAFALATSYWCFPRLSVHVVVVDPGVGSQRAAIVARTADYMFVAPDN